MPALVATRVATVVASGTRRCASPTFCSRCRPCPGCFGASFWRRWRKRTEAARSRAIRKRPDGPRQARQRQLYKHAWVVYAKTPLGGPAQVLEYLSRYTHRTAISHARIRQINAHAVAFTVRADGHGGKRVQWLAGAEFVRRFMLHVLPTGIKRVRHYGLLASSCKGLKLAAARAALQMPAVSLPALESARAFMTRVARIDIGLCPRCKAARLHVTATVAGFERLPAPGKPATPLPHSRGPP